LKLLSLKKGLRRGNVESSISPYTKTIGLFGAHEFELRVALRIVDHRHSFYHDDFVEQGRSEPLDSNRSVTGSRLVERDLAIGDVNCRITGHPEATLATMILVSQTDLVPDGSLRGEAASVRVRVRGYRRKRWRTLIAGVCEEAGEGRGTEADSRGS